MSHTREEWKSALGEGIHTGFRKGTDHPDSAAASKFIAHMDPKMWDDVLSFTVWGLESMGMIAVAPERAEQ